MVTQSAQVLNFIQSSLIRQHGASLKRDVPNYWRSLMWVDSQACYHATAVHYVALSLTSATGQLKKGAALGLLQQLASAYPTLHGPSKIPEGVWAALQQPG